MKSFEQLIEYMKIHLISLEQDRVNSDYKFSAKECLDLNGQIKATQHLLSTAQSYYEEL